MKIQIRQRDRKVVAAVAGLNAVAFLSFGMHLNGAAQFLIGLGFAIAAWRNRETQTPQAGEEE